MGDINKTPELRALLQEHHRLMKELYPLSVKTKLHAGLHIPDYWERWRILIACFSPERFHKRMKGTMRFSFNKCTHTCLARRLYEWFIWIDEEITYEPVHFEGTVYAIPDELRHLLRNLVQWATSIRTQWGVVGKDNLVYFKTRGCTNIGVAKGFAKSLSGDYVCIIQQCSNIVGTSSWRRLASHEVVAIDCIVEICLFVELDADTFVPMNRLE